MDFEKIKTIRNKLRPKPKSPHFSAVIVAAGNSQRMGNDKLMAELGGKPVLARTLMAFQKSEYVDEIIVVTRVDRIEEIADLCKKYNIDKASKVICGGATRTESALAGVSEVQAKARLIGIHDGARPLVSQAVIERTAVAARDYLSAVPAIRSTDTLKKIDENGVVVDAVDRECTVRIQTPQIFAADYIKGALTNAMNKGVALTDDCSAMEAMGVKTHVVEGDENNIKLTTPRDMIFAEAILRERGE